MNRVDQNINKDMNHSDIIDVDSLDFSDDQTWLYKHPNDTGERVDMVDWSLSLDWPSYEDDDYLNTEKELFRKLDEVLKNQFLAMPDKHKFDSRTYVKPKKRVLRPSIQNIVEVPSNPPSLSPTGSLNQPSNKYLTYNKYNAPLGPILRLKTFNVDTNTENSNAVKEYAMKRRSLVQDDDQQLEDANLTLLSDVSERLSATKPINIDLSQPAHNLHNTFNRGLTNIISDRGSFPMYQSGESLMRMSPPSLVSSLLMENSGNFNNESIDKKSITSHRDSGLPISGRDSIDPMMTSMTLSILDEKDMSTSFLSQTTYPDNDSLIDSLPPSLVSSVNSSYVVNSSKQKDSTDSNNIFSSVTFTHLEQSQRLLSARPRCQLYNSFKRESLRNSESYTKAREEACQIDSPKVLTEIKRDSPKTKTNEMGETITLHYANDMFRRDSDAEKENVNASFEKDDAFYKEMGMQRAVDSEKNSMNITLDKQELNEIIQARQKLSLARKALPTETERPLPNQIELPVRQDTQPIVVPKRNMENASELLARRRAFTNGVNKPEEVSRDTPKRNATFKKPSPKGMDTTVVYVKDENNIIDINSATLKLLNNGDRTLQQEEWGSQERAMVGSSESTDTGTFSSSSPPDSVPDTTSTHDHRAQVASTPLSLRKTSKHDLLNLHTTISPIYDMIDDKSYTVTKVPSEGYEGNPTVINTATLVKKTNAKRDILAGRISPEKKVADDVPQHRSPPKKMPPPNTGPYNSMGPPTGLPKKTGLPTSKLRQYSSHRDLRLPLAGATGAASRCSLASGSAGQAGARVGMLRRAVYASNPALSPTAPSPPQALAAPVSRAPYALAARRDSYTIAVDDTCPEKSTKPVFAAPPALVRQGTETLRRERPQSQLVQPKDPPTTRPYSIGGATQLRVTRPASGPVQKNVAVISSETRPSSTIEQRVSGLPRPSRLPAPRRSLRPPSVYSVAPTADVDHY